MVDTADRVKRMAELLGENKDEWNALAGRVAEELPKIINEEPTEVPDLLRAVRGMTASQIRALRQAAEQIKIAGRAEAS